MDEMVKLRNALTARGVKWVTNNDDYLQMLRIKFFMNNDFEDTMYSVITGPYSYGGKDGLLEIMPPVHERFDLDDVEGWLTAEDIIQALFG